MGKKIENEKDPSKPIDWYDLYKLDTALKSFEAVLSAELALSPMYVVTPKAAYDTQALIADGSSAFPKDLKSKVPEAIFDIEQGTKCIALEVPTAAAFHLHRANESILRRYWDAIAEGKSRPKTRNIGDYLKAMEKHQIGDPNVIAALRHLKDFHRNPLIHPDHTLENVDQAIALLNGIHTVAVYMLATIPFPVVNALTSVGMGTALSELFGQHQSGLGMGALGSLVGPKATTDSSDEEPF